MSVDIYAVEVVSPGGVITQGLKMTDYKINPDVFVRLATASLQSDEKHDKYDAIIRGVRIECRDGVALAVASCGPIIVVECIEESGEDGTVTITNDPRMMELAEAEAAASGMLMITQAPGWTVVRGLETGKMLPINGEIVGDWPDWRALMPGELPSKNNGAFVLVASWLSRIASASPSGTIVLPKFADKKQPLVIRDLNDDNWIALVLMAHHNDNNDYAPAEIPEWFKP